jgi:hypothetical protein
VRGAGVALRCRKQCLGAHARDFVVRQVHLRHPQPFVPRDAGLLKELCNGYGAPVAKGIFPKEYCAYCCDVGSA